MTSFQTQQHTFAFAGVPEELFGGLCYFSRASRLVIKFFYSSHVQRNAELVKLQEDSHARQEAERLRVEQQIQAERRAAEQYAVGGRGVGGWGVKPNLLGKERDCCRWTLGCCRLLRGRGLRCHTVQPAEPRSL